MDGIHAKTGRRRWSRGIGIACCGFGIHLLAASAWAQTDAILPNEDGGLLQWGIAVGVIVVVALTGFLNPKRSHLS